MKYSINVAKAVGRNWNNSGPQWHHESRIHLPDGTDKADALQLFEEYRAALPTKHMTLTAEVTLREDIFENIPSVLMGVKL